MKKIFLVAALAALTISASAQMQKGFRSAFEITGAMSKYSGLENASNAFCYGAGWTVEYNFNRNLYLGTGLDFGLRGSKVDGLRQNGQYLYCNNTVRSYNLMIPVNIGARINPSDNVSIFVQAGPYVSVAIAKKKVTSPLGDMKPETFDWGFDAKLGVEFYQFRVFGGYELGMQKVWNYDQGKNRSIVFGIGYTL